MALRDIAARKTLASVVVDFGFWNLDMTLPRLESYGYLTGLVVLSSSTAVVFQLENHPYES